MLRNEGQEQRHDLYEDSLRSARLLGVEVHLSGSMPETGEARRIVSMAIETCATNTVRHAGGNLLFVTCRQDGDRYTLLFRNNGERPKKPIRESGGLANLRAETERIGGTMYVHGRPAFVLMLELPDERNRFGADATLW